jgi:hypothetical protein
MFLLQILMSLDAGCGRAVACIMQLFRDDGSMPPCCGNWSVMSAAKCETGHNGRRETSLRKMVLAAPTD